LATKTRPGERDVYSTVPQSQAQPSAPVTRSASRTPRSLVVVSGQAQRAELLDALLVDTNDYDIVFVESIARGYSRIKQVTPDLVVVHSEIDDVAACRLLSMLTIDRDVSRIPVVTCPMPYDVNELDDDIVEFDPDSPSRTLPIPMN
jgi:PleD family two-component response regulator